MKKVCYITTLSITIQSFFISQLRYLSENGFDVTVICSPDDQLKTQLGDNVRYIPLEIPRGISVIGSIKAIWRLMGIFIREKFDIIQYSTPNAALYSSIAATLSGCKIRNYHVMGFRYLGAKGTAQSILRSIEKLTCAISTDIECVSKSNLEIGVNDRIFKREKVTVVWNGSSGGVDLRRFNEKLRDHYRKEIRARYGIAEDEFVYGYVGRITRDKGVNEVLSAFGRIKNATLIMVGSPEGIKTLNEALYQDSLKNRRIIYTGNVEQVEKYYAAIDVLLLPSYREGFGNAIIEAAAMRTPAIVSRIPGPIDAVVDGKTALTVSPRSEEELLEAMQRIQSADNRKMGEAACEYVRSHFASDALNRFVSERKQKLIEG